MKRRRRGELWPYALLAAVMALLAGTLYLSLSGGSLSAAKPLQPDASLSSLALSPSPSATAGDSLGQPVFAPPSPDPVLVDQPTGDGPLNGLVIGLDATKQKNANPGQEPLAPGAKAAKDMSAPGAVGISTGQQEYSLNLTVALKLEDLLLANGATVVITRKTDDVDLSNAVRAQLMNDEKVNLCLEIAASGSDNLAVCGASIYIPGGRYTAAIADPSRRAAEIIFQSFLDETGAKSNGLSRTDDLTAFNYSRVPICQVALGFLSNPNEDRLLAAAAYQDKCAQGLYNGIAAWFGAGGE